MQCLPPGTRLSDHYSLWCVLSTSMTFPCAMKTVRESPDPPFPVLVMQYIQRWGREWSGSRD